MALSIVAFLTVVNSVIGAAIAIDREEPAGWLGISTGLTARNDFLYGLGTGISPPLWFLILFVAASWAPIWGGRARRLGTAALALSGLIILIGQLGEPITYRALSASGLGSAESLIVIGNLILAAALLFFGARALVADRVAPQNENVF